MIYSLSEDYYVRGLKESDLEGNYFKWFEDQDICRFNSHGKFFKNIDWFRDYIGALNNEDRVIWAICHKNDGHIGNVALQELSFINRTAEFSIILGDKNHIGRGVSKMASIALIQHGFNKLNLNRIYCGTADTNIAMKKLAISLGMSEEGCRRKQLFLDGEFVDIVEYGLLREEFNAKELSKQK